jgi:hypothetical protein
MSHWERAVEFLHLVAPTTEASGFEGVARGGASMSTRMICRATPERSRGRAEPYISAGGQATTRWRALGSGRFAGETPQSWAGDGGAPWQDPFELWADRRRALSSVIRPPSCPTNRRTM